LLKKVAKSVSKLHGFAVHVNYSALFEKTSYHIIPFKDLRFTTHDHKEHPNMLALYDDWQKVKRQKIDHKKIEYFHFYNPNPAAIQEQVDEAGGWANYNGQIFYWSIDGRQYPLAPSDPILEDMQTDSHAKIFKFRNITTNFMASHIFETNEFEDEHEKDEFIEVLADFQGADEALKILLLEKKAEQEQSFNLQKVDIQDVEKLYEYTETSVRDNIIRQYVIPPVLLLATPGKLGSSSEIIEATAFYNGITSEYRQSISEIFEELLNNSIYITGENFEIKEIKPSVIDLKETTEGKAKAVEVLSNEKLSDYQKRAVLKLIYRYNEADINELMGPLKDIQVK
jgi:hypothetical protein